MTQRRDDGRAAGSLARRLFVAALMVLMALPAGSAVAAPVITTQLSPGYQVGVVGGTATVTATVKFDNAAPPVGTAVQFFVHGVNETAGVAYTNSQGVTTYSYTGHNPGADQVIASVATVTSEGVTVDWIQTTAAALDLSPDNFTALTGSTQTFTILVTGAADQPVENIPVRYRVTGANPHSETGGTTDANGKVTFSYAGNNAGTDTVTAYIDLNGNGSQDPGESITDSSTVTWTTAGGVSLAPALSFVDIDSDATLVATVTDAQGRPLGGVDVSYSITGANPASGTVTTGANGSATITHPGNNAGTDTVNVVVSGVNQHASATIHWYDGPATIALSASSTTLAAGTTVTVTATVKDAAGNPIPQLPVHFAVAGTGATSADKTTGNDGTATFSYTGAGAGVDTVTAFADLNQSGKQEAGEPNASLKITWTAVAGLSLTPASQQHTVGDSANLTATLSNPAGSAENVTVRYSVSGANTATGSVTTGSGGTATISYSGSAAGTDTVTAYADLNNSASHDAGEPSATAAVTWTAKPTPPVFQPAQPASPKAGCTYFPATHHNLCAGFAAYWNAFGGLPIYGLPITEEFTEHGLTVQYFERARFEWQPGAWPERYDVLLGLLGDELTQSRQAEAPFQPTSAKAGCRYFAATGHNLCAGFGAYWDAYGGLAVYGMPISEEFVERNPDTGQLYTVQYFERQRFEWHPGEAPGRYDVLLGRVGVQVLALHAGTP